MNNLNFGLKKARFKDPRQFKFHKTFGVFPIEKIPPYFDFGTVPVIKDQGTTFFCTGESGAYAIGHVLQKEISPEYIIQKTVELGDLDYRNFFGTTPQLSDKAVVKCGSIFQSLSPFVIGRDDPVELANPNNWPTALDADQQRPFGASFEITKDGYKDLFDAVCVALYTKKFPTRFAVWWQPQWTSAPGGMITADIIKNFKKGINGHSIQVDPAVVIKDGVKYLRVPNSWGTSVGDNGYYYFSREAVDRTFYVSAYDPTADPEQIKREQWNLIQIILDKVIKILRLLQDKFCP